MSEDESSEEEDSEIEEEEDEEDAEVTAGGSADQMTKEVPGPDEPGGEESGSGKEKLEEYDEEHVGDESEDYEDSGSNDEVNVMEVQTQGLHARLGPRNLRVGSRTNARLFAVQKPQSQILSQSKESMVKLPPLSPVIHVSFY